MRQFYALAPGTGRFRNSCYFGNLLLSGEQIPPCSGPVERGLCAAVRDGRKPANGLWPSGTPVQRHCGKHTDGQTAFREPASIHFSRTVTAEPSGRGTAASPPYWSEPRHTGKSGVSTPFYRAAGKTIRPYLLFPRPVR